MNLNERKHYDKLTQMGCIVCKNLSYGYSAPHIHHIRHGAGIGRKNPYWKAIPLCPNHHLNGGYGVAIHAGQKAFEQAYGSEEQLLEQVNKLLEKM